MSVHPLASAARRFDVAKPSSFTRASRSLARGPLVLVGVALAALILITWRLRPHPYTSGGPWSTSPMAPPLVTTVASTSVHPEQQQRRSVVPPLFRPLVKGKDYFSDYDISSALQHFTPAEATAPNVRPPLFRYVEPALVSEYAVHYVSNEPRVAVVQDFLTAAECDALIHEASKSMFRSQVAPTQGSKDAPVQEVRTSSQAWLHAASDPARPIVQRILALTGFPPGSNEELQILRYEVSQKYDAHNDYFDPKMYGPQQTNRALTFYLYLSDVEEGGETWFPRADGKPPTFDFTSCSRGLGVRPKRGMAVIFYDMKPNGELDPYSLHGACPVKKGVKWGGTLWLRMPTP